MMYLRVVYNGIGEDTVGEPLAIKGHDEYEVRTSGPSAVRQSWRNQERPANAAVQR